MKKAILLVILGGGLGAVLRECLMVGVAKLPGGFPMPIFIANMSACFLIGLVTALTVQGGMFNADARLFLNTGVMGGLSTFSSFVWGTDKMLIHPPERLSAVIYLVGSMVLGFVLVRLGLSLGGRLKPVPAPAATGR
jgi:fluoride exporter